MNYNNFIEFYHVSNLIIGAILSSELSWIWENTVVVLT